MPKLPIDLNAYREQRSRKRRAAIPSPSVGIRRRPVPCARCQAPIPGHARRCPQCGVHFSGCAADFAAAAGRPAWIKVTAIALIVILLAATLLIDW